MAIVTAIIANNCLTARTNTPNKEILWHVYLEDFLQPEKQTWEYLQGIITGNRHQEENSGLQSWW